MIDLFHIMFGTNGYSVSPEDETAILWLGMILSFIGGMIAFYNIEQFIRMLAGL